MAEYSIPLYFPPTYTFDPCTHFHYLLTVDA